MLWLYGHMLLSTIQIYTVVWGKLVVGNVHEKKIHVKKISS